MALDLKFLKPNKRFQKKKGWARPEFYWQGILLLALASALGFAIFAFYLFRKISGETAVSSPLADQQAEMIKKERIQKALDYFAQRAKKSENIINSPAPLTDPS